MAQWSAMMALVAAGGGRLGLRTRFTQRLVPNPERRGVTVVMHGRSCGVRAANEVPRLSSGV
jgi:hypothetical protein